MHTYLPGVLTQRKKTIGLRYDRSAFAHQWQWQSVLLWADSLTGLSLPLLFMENLGCALPILIRSLLSFCLSHQPTHLQGPTVLQVALLDCICSWCACHSKHSVYKSPCAELCSVITSSRTENQHGLQWNLVLPGWESVHGFPAAGAILAITLLSAEPSSSFLVSWCSRWCPALCESIFIGMQSFTQKNLGTGSYGSLPIV